MVRSGEVSWVQPKEKGSKPGPRSGHSITCTQEKAIIFGGCGIQDGRSAIFNETYILHISDQFRWELAEVTGDVPSPRVFDLEPPDFFSLGAAAALHRLGSGGGGNGSVPPPTAGGHVVSASPPAPAGGRK